MLLSCFPVPLYATICPIYLFFEAKLKALSLPSVQVMLLGLPMFKLWIFPSAVGMGASFATMWQEFSSIANICMRFGYFAVFCELFASLIFPMCCMEVVLAHITLDTACVQRCHPMNTRQTANRMIFRRVDPKVRVARSEHVVNGA